VNLVLIRWRDAHHEFEQDTSDRPQEDFIVETIGYLIARDELFISVAQERLPDGRYRGVTHLPLASIIGGSQLVEASETPAS